MKLHSLRYAFIALFIPLAMSSINVIAQSKEAFEKIFDKETQSSQMVGYGKFRTIERVSFYPDTLPSWFFRPPVSTGSIIYAIGISDPDLTPEEAAFQALHRARSMAVMFNKTLFQYFRDVYTVEYNEGRYKDFGQRFDTYLKLSGSAFADSNCFTIEKYHITRYNEAIVLVSYKPATGRRASRGDQISTIGTALYIEAQIGQAFEPQAEYEIATKHAFRNGSAATSNFTYREKGKRFLAISEFLGKNNDFPIYNYKYVDPNWPKNSQPLITYNGLWSVFTKKFMRQLILETEETSVYIKSLGESYDKETRNISREIVTKTARMHINGIEFGEDSIRFDLEIVELK